MEGVRTGPLTPAAWQHPASAVATELGTDLVEGLSSQAAAARLGRDGPNALEPPPPVPGWRKLARQFADPLVYLLLGAIVVAAIAWLLDGADGVPVDVVVIAAIVLANGILGFVQQNRAERAVAALQQLAAATAEVVRDGHVERVDATTIVPGDLLVLEEGDAVPADARLVHVDSLVVSEASLTGESEPIPKSTAPIPPDALLADRTNMVFGGTVVTRGRARAVVTATGPHTEMGRIAGLLARPKREQTPLQQEVARVGRLIGIAVVAIAAVIVTTVLVMADVGTASDVVDVLVLGVSLAVAAVPESLPAILTLVLALGVLRMARNHAIVRRLSSVETLGSASVVCADKTGTLTRNEMTVVTVVTASGDVTVTGSGYRPEGEPFVDGRRLDGSEAADRALLDELRWILSGGSLANDAALRREGSGEWTIQGDPTDAAFLVAEAKLGWAPARRARFERLAEIPFTSERRLVSTLERDRSADSPGEGFVLFTKGAPDVVLSRCTHERVAGQVRPLTDDRRRELASVVDDLADRALRPISVAYRTLADPGSAHPESVDPDESLEQGLVFLGTVGMIDPPRPEVRAAIAEAHAAGIRVLMITGDHPRTATRIAADLGIADPGSHPLTGTDLAALGDEALRDATRSVTIYARVAPEDKLRIVDALHADGHVVAMTGDGVNDAPALEAADIGIAMGIAGTDVTRAAADMVLTDDNFATIVTATREGRGILDNIRAFLRFLLSSNFGEVLTMFLGVVLAGVIGLTDTGEAVAVPLLATQILWINLLTDSAPALAMGLDPPADDVMTRPPRRRTDQVIDREMLVGIAWIGLVMSVVTLVALDLRLPGGLLGGSGDIVEARTMAFTTLVLAQLFNCFNTRSERTSAFRHLFTNRLLWAAIAGSLALQVAVVHLPALNDAFHTTPLGLDDWLVCTALASVVLVAGEARKLVARRLRTRPSRPRRLRTRPSRP